MENEQYLTFYFITDKNKLSNSDMLRLELVAGIEAVQMNWKLFNRIDTSAGEFYLSLN